MKEISLNVFCTKLRIVENFLDQEEIYKTLDLVEKVEQVKHNELLGDATSSYSESSNIIEDTSIEKKLNNQIQLYCDESRIESTKINISWINIQKKGSILKWHNHYPSSISGALWLRTDDQSNDLVLRNPNYFIKNIFKGEKNDVEYSEYINIKPKMGSLIIFPGWLEHGSNYVNNNSDERIVLSFNCK